MLTRSSSLLFFSFRFYNSIPPPPSPPPNDSCCGTGCSNCVWIEYWEELEKYNAKYNKDHDTEEIFSKNIEKDNIDQKALEFIEMEKRLKNKKKKKT